MTPRGKLTLLLGVLTYLVAWLFGATVLYPAAAGLVLAPLAARGWVRLAVQSPDTNDIWLYERGEFRPYAPQADRLPSAASSADWYRGWRDHLEFAESGTGPV